MVLETDMPKEIDVAPMQMIKKSVTLKIKSFFLWIASFFSIHFLLMFTNIF